MPVDASQEVTSEVVRAVDRTAEAGHAYRYRIVVKNGTQTYTFGPIAAQSQVAITEFALSRVTPTPTRQRLLRLRAPRSSFVRISIVDVQGVKSPVSRKASRTPAATKVMMGTASDAVRWPR